MSDITIRFAGPEDGDALAAMIDAMDRYHGDPVRPAGGPSAAARRLALPPSPSCFRAPGCVA